MNFEAVHKAMLKRAAEDDYIEPTDWHAGYNGYIGPNPPKDPNRYGGPIYYEPEGVQIYNTGSKDAVEKWTYENAIKSILKDVRPKSLGGKPSVNEQADQSTMADAIQFNAPTKATVGGPWVLPWGTDKWIAQRSGRPLAASVWNDPALKAPLNDRIKSKAPVIAESLAEKPKAKSSSIAEFLKSFKK